MKSLKGKFTALQWIDIFIFDRNFCLVQFYLGTSSNINFFNSIKILTMNLPPFLVHLFSNFSSSNWKIKIDMWFESLLSLKSWWLDFLITHVKAEKKMFWLIIDSMMLKHWCNLKELVNYKISISPKYCS
jgi:hypothetical protein